MLIIIFVSTVSCGVLGFAVAGWVRMSTSRQDQQGLVAEVHQAHNTSLHVYGEKEKIIKLYKYMFVIVLLVLSSNIRILIMANYNSNLFIK